jgi:hypothetical protein
MVIETCLPRLLEDRLKTLPGYGHQDNAPGVRTPPEPPRGLGADYPVQADVQHHDIRPEGAGQPECFRAVVRQPRVTAHLDR